MKSEVIAVVGVLTVVISVLVKILGGPDQIKKNYRRKSTEGLSTVFFGLSFVSYLLWTLYGVLKGDLVVVLGQGLGVLITGAVVYQIWIYRGSKDES